MKKLIRIISLSVIVALASCTTEGLYGLSVSRPNIVFVLDVSSSMEGRHEEVLWKRETQGFVDQAAKLATREIDERSPITGIGSAIYNALNDEARQNLTKLAGAKREIVPTIKQLNKKTKFTVILFSSQTLLWRSELMPSTEENKRLATTFLAEANASSGTSIGAALAAALEVNGVEEIFLITDGAPTDQAPSEILDQVQKLNAVTQVRISTVGIGKDQDAEFLDAVASQNDGAFVQRLN